MHRVRLPVARELPVRQSRRPAGEARPGTPSLDRGPFDYAQGEPFGDAQGRPRPVALERGYFAGVADGAIGVRLGGAPFDSTSFLAMMLSTFESVLKFVMYAVLSSCSLG